MRGLAALVVVVFHYQHFFLVSDLARPLLPPVSEFPYAGLLAPLYSHGDAAVELFWMISGLVFAHVYLTRPVGFWPFAVARFARLYPLHLATLLIVLVLQTSNMHWLGYWQIYSNNDMLHFSLQLVMSSNWTAFSKGLSFNGPIWSVSLEVVAYLLFFLSLPILRRFGLFGGVALTALFWAIGLMGPVMEIPYVRSATFICAGYFFTGVCLYLITLRTAHLTWPIYGLVIAGIGLAIFGAVSQIQLLLLVGVCVSLLTTAVLLDLQGLRHQPRILKTMGDISYSIYLVHVPLQMLFLFIMDLTLDGTRSFAESHLLLPAYLAVVLLCSYYTHRYFEKPASRKLRQVLLPR